MFKKLTFYVLKLNVFSIYAKIQTILRFLFVKGGNMKIKHKMALINIITSSIIIICFITNYIFTIRQYNDLLYTQTAHSLSFFTDELSYLLDNIESTATYISFNTDFQESLEIFNRESSSSLTGQKARYNISQVIHKYYSSEITQITVLSENDNTVWWGKSEFSGSETFIENIKSLCDSKEGQLIWIPFDSKSSNVVCARRILKSANLSLQPMGYLLIEVNLDELVKSKLNARYQNTDEFSIYISSDHTVIYPNIDDINYVQESILSPHTGAYAIKNINGKGTFITDSSIKLSNAVWDLFMVVPYDNIFHTLKHNIIFFIASLIIAIIATYLLSSSMIKNFSSQFHILVNKMSNIEIGNLKENDEFKLVPPRSEDELTVLNAYFDQMIIRLQKLIEESYVKQLLITEADLKALEQQVNPHFLYNTLNTVNWLAKKSHADEISIIAESLGNMLQNTLNNKHTLITLNNELEIVTSFIQIQKIRFDDLCIFTDVDETILEALIPKMTIQPLIENAIIYAQSEIQDTYQIFLSIWQEDQEIMIRVKNTGSAFDENLLEKIKNKTIIPKGNGIGLVNIDSRLRLIFGENYHLHFENDQDKAIVWFSIPRGNDNKEYFTYV